MRKDGPQAKGHTSHEGGYKANCLSNLNSVTVFFFFCLCVCVLMVVDKCVKM